MKLPGSVYYRYVSLYDNWLWHFVGQYVCLKVKSFQFFQDLIITFSNHTMYRLMQLKLLLSTLVQQHRQITNRVWQLKCNYQLWNWEKKDSVVLNGSQVINRFEGDEEPDRLAKAASRSNNICCSLLKYSVLVSVSEKKKPRNCYLQSTCLIISKLLPINTKWHDSWTFKVVFIQFQFGCTFTQHWVRQI